MNYIELCDQIIGSLSKDCLGHKLDEKRVAFMNNYIHQKIHDLKMTALIPEDMDIKFKTERDEYNINGVEVKPDNKFTEHIAQYRNRSDFYDLTHLSEEDMKRDIHRVTSDY